MISLITAPLGYFWGMTLADAVLHNDPVTWVGFGAASASVIIGLAWLWREATP